MIESDLQAGPVKIFHFLCGPKETVREIINFVPCPMSVVSSSMLWEKIQLS